MTDDLDDLIEGPRKEPMQFKNAAEKTKRCPVCRGSGVLPGRRRRCWICKGEGVVADRKR